MATKDVMALIGQANIDKLLARHASGDWGDMSQEDKEHNNQSLTSNKGQLFSSYSTPVGKVWIITEYDRTITTVLIPSER